MRFAKQQGRLWKLVAQLEAQTLEEWRREHYPLSSFESCLGMHLMSVLTKVERTKGGNVSVTIHAMGEVDGKEHLTYFRLQRKNKSTFVILDHGAPSTSA